MRDGSEHERNESNDANARPSVLGKFLIGNIQGLKYKSSKAKIKLLEELAEHDNSIIIALNETHFTEDILDSEFQIKLFFEVNILEN